MPAINQPFPILTDVNGQPLEDGYVWIGQANLDPQANPISVFWDAGLTISAPQPIRTRDGYLMNNGTPGILYVGSEYSIRVQDKTGRLVYSLSTSVPISSDGVSFTQGGSGAVTRSLQTVLREIVRAGDFGAVGDGVTDDSAAINAAAVRAESRGALLYIPGTLRGYRLNGPLTFTGMRRLKIAGEGVLIPVGGPAMVFDNTQHAEIEGIGIYGTSTSTDGIRLTNSSNNNKFQSMWIGWVNRDAIRIESGQSNTFTDIDCDQNNGFRPITLQGGLTDGSIKHSVNVLSDSVGNTNNNSFVNCRSNAAGETYSVKVGDPGSFLVETFSWQGGLIQGPSSYQALYLRTRDAIFDGAHIEPPVGATSNYLITFDGALNSSVQNCSVQGDVWIKSGSDSCGLKNVRGAGLRNDGIRSFWLAGNYRNIITGPTSGTLQDRVGDMRLEGVWNASSSNFAASNLLTVPTPPFFATDFSNWYDTTGSGAVAPYGFTIGSGVTIENSIKYGQFFSAEVIPASDLADSLICSLPAYAVGRKVYVNAWVYNEGAAGAGYIVGKTSAITVGQQSFQQNKWERMQVSFFLDAGTTPRIVFTGLSGQKSYWGSVQIFIEDAPTQIETGYVDVTLQATGGGTITLASGNNRLQYTKIGRQVTYTGYLSVSSVSSPTGNLRITGLNHTCGTSVGKTDFWTAVNCQITQAGIAPVQARIVGGTNRIEIYKITGGNWDFGGCAANIVANTDIYVNATYFTD